MGKIKPLEKFNLVSRLETIKIIVRGGRGAEGQGVKGL